MLWCTIVWYDGFVVCGGGVVCVGVVVVLEWSGCMVVVYGCCFVYGVVVVCCFV